MASILIKDVTPVAAELTDLVPVAKVGSTQATVLTVASILDLAKAGPGPGQAFSVGSLSSAGNVSISGGSWAVGSLYKTAPLGLVMAGVSGSSYDMVLASIAGQYLFANPANTNNVALNPSVGSTLIGSPTVVTGAKLEVTGAISATGALTSNTNISVTGVAQPSIILTTNGAGANTFQQFVNSAGNFYIFNNNGSSYAFGIAKATSNVFVGATGEDGSNAKLQVAGALNLTGKVVTTGVSGGTGVSGSDGAGGYRVKWASGYGVSLDAWDGSTPKWGITKYSVDTPKVMIEGVFNSNNVCFNSGGNVIVGAASEDGTSAKLQVAGGISLATGGQSIRCAADNSSLAICGGTSTPNGAWINLLGQTAGSPSVMTFGQGDGSVSNEVARFSANYNFLVGKTADDGLAKIQSSNGITLGNDNNAGATVLDWYEEGKTVLTLTSATPPTTPPTATAKWTRIGNRVLLSVNFANVNTTGGAGAMSITGLRDTSHSETQYAHGKGYQAGLGSVAVVPTIKSTSNSIVFHDPTLATRINIVAGTGKYLAITIEYFI